jgi:hypothetical protein
MRKLLITLVLAFAAAAAGGDPGIDADALLTHIKFLASDDLKGRANGSEGLERAGDYVAQQFKTAGLAPGEGEGWFQPFELIAGLTVGKGNALSFEYQGKKVGFVLGTSYYPLAAPGGDTLPSVQLQHLPLVFAGYGIAIPDIGYDDYSRVDVKD